MVTCTTPPFRAAVRLNSGVRPRWRQQLNFDLQHELEFFERGFGLSPLHDRDEGVFSYVRAYENGRQLTLTFDIGSVSTLRVNLAEACVPLSDITVEGFKALAFQSWHGERIVRVDCDHELSRVDLRVHYDPAPSIHMTALRSGA